MTSRARRVRRDRALAEAARQRTPVATGAHRSSRGGHAPTGAREAAVGAAGETAGLDRGRTLRLIGLSVGLCAAAIGLIVVVFGFAHLWYGLHDISDTSIYFDYAARMAHGFRPYVDFPIEYPPLAIPLFLIPGHTNDVVAYTDWFNVEMFAMLAAAAAATAAAAAHLWRTGRKAWLVDVAFAGSVLATGAIVGNRYDAAVAFILALFLLLLARGYWTAAALALGIGFALKLTPAILLPLVLVLAVRRRSIAWGACYFALGAFLPFIPYLINGTKGLEYIFTYHLHRPLQIESVLATPLLFGHVIGRLWVEVGTAYGSQFVAATGADTLARLSGVLELVALAVTYGLIWRRRATLRATPRLVPLAVLSLILAFMTFGKVLSPQYFIWILPVVALVIVERRILGFVLIAVLLLTQIEFPANYWSFIALDHGPLMLVIARNMLLLVAFLLTLWHLWNLPASADAAGGVAPTVLGKR
jgi:hypothetical protein